MKTPRAGRAAYTVACVNGVLVMLMPMAFLLATRHLSFDTNASVTVHAPGLSRLPAMVSTVKWSAMVLLPFASLAAWRSFVYARWRRDGHDRSWWAVAEAGGWGLAAAVVPMVPGLVRRPTDAGAYVIVYWGYALIAGLLVGLFLRASALLVFKLRGSAP